MAITFAADLSARLLQKHFDLVHPLWPINVKPSLNLDPAVLVEALAPTLVSAIHAIAASRGPIRTETGLEFCTYNYQKRDCKYAFACKKR